MTKIYAADFYVAKTYIYKKSRSWKDWTKGYLNNEDIFKFRALVFFARQYWSGSEVKSVCAQTLVDQYKATDVSKLDSVCAQTLVDQYKATDVSKLDEAFGNVMEDLSAQVLNYFLKQIGIIEKHTYHSESHDLLEIIIEEVDSNIEGMVPLEILKKAKNDPDFIEKTFNENVSLIELESVLFFHMMNDWSPNRLARIPIEDSDIIEALDILWKEHKNSISQATV